MRVRSLPDAPFGVEIELDCRAPLDPATGRELLVLLAAHDLLVVRGGSPTARDRVLATRLAATAVAELARGVSGVVTGLRGEDIVTTPLSEVTGKTKPADMKLLELARTLAQ